MLGATILARSFSQYWLHRASHAIPILWRLHRIHHSDTHFDASLALRRHPLELIPALAIHLGVTIALGLPVWAVVIVDTLLVAANFWEHLALRIPPAMQRILGIVFVTPRAHRIHHSALREQTDSNFGSALIVWDRLFGSYRNPARDDVRRIGLGPHDDLSAASLTAQLVQPFRPTEPPPG